MDSSEMESILCNSPVVVITTREKHRPVQPRHNYPPPSHAGPLQMSHLPRLSLSAVGHYVAFGDSHGSMSNHHPFGLLNPPGGKSSQLVHHHFKTNLVFTQAFEFGVTCHSIP
ncbi:hypothetical protein ACLOJK_010674 [Asimina triloba]